MDETLADIKGKLAQHGVDIHPSGELVHRHLDTSQPYRTMVLDQVVKGWEPPYCIHGYAPCLVCNAECYLGSETVKIALEDQVVTICVACATKHLIDYEQSDHIRDHLRADGIHD